MQIDWSEEEAQYVERLATRYTQYRKSAAIDRDDLKSAAMIRWWRFRTRHPEVVDEKTRQICFYQQVKGAMRDVVRDSAPVKVTRTMQAKMKAYQRPSTVTLDHVIDVRAVDTEHDRELWMDVLNELRRLPEREQLILSLYFEQGLNFTEIAQVLDVSVSTVTRAYQKSIDTLRKNL
ncbi:sigma-70 family RNA polymerase sigma factor [Alicyclobacillus sp. SO9]|uniref:sigma-70 family RNA polymerase sigma factor n=1 Tax=Alicyclobacillus sp. SO9 TaxID=2665646 RepID=UPI0018E73BC9|nr:sigma-70 family RNA polymerase sigma factor [Alicyclobacillus sp. SO9]QQE78119.1 sigma-70 family RNA polymerase sigma factor [Alicyclobacillus sp. SO9]